MPKRECSYRQVLCATIAGEAEGGLRASGRGKAKGRSKVDCGNSDPMREAGEPSTWKSLACVTKCCARPTGVVMVAPQKAPRNAERAQSTGRAAFLSLLWRGQRQYRGRGPTPSFAAAREPYPSRELLQRCYKGAYRG